MKRRLYYLAENLDVVEAVRKELERRNLKQWNFHVLSKDSAGIYKRHLHSANVLQTSDLWRLGERGALIGFLLGIAAALFGIGVLGFFRNYMFIASIVIISIVTMHGAWMGGMAGLGRENYKIKRFHNDIENGRILLIIDLAKDDRESIERALNALPMQACGSDPVLTLPFDQPQKNM